MLCWWCYVELLFGSERTIGLLHVEVVSIIRGSGSRIE